jgi:hypothetical protein
MAFKVGVGKSDFASLRKSGNSYLISRKIAHKINKTHHVQYVKTAFSHFMSC